MNKKNYLAIFAKSFNWAGFFLPKKIYEDSAKLYAFCRVLDDIADEKTDLNSKIKNFQSGWNLWSIKTIQRYFNKKIIKHPFEIKINVKKNKKDLMRSWTIRANKKLRFINAISFLQNQMWLEIKNN